MLQLGDKGARQGKKILVKPNLALGSTAIAVLGDHFANPIRPEA